jgi:ERCC4-type nuclease
MIELYKYTDKEQKQVLESLTILLDTREKSNKHIVDWLNRKNKKYKQQKLDYGDYSFFIPENTDLGIYRDLYFDGKVAIERKGCLDELAGNFTKDRARIEKEFSLFKGNMKMIIENATYEDVKNGKYKSAYSPESFLGTLHSFNSKYGVDFVFMADNESTPLYIYLHFIHWLRNYMRG